ncbi:MAG: hypothetical protein ABEJ80_05595 [Halarchaeum sp.]
MGRERGQSEVVGVVLLLGLTIAGTTVLVTASGGAIDATQQRAATENAENVMTLFDAKASLVALGRTDAQAVDLPRGGGGDYEVRPGTGWIELSGANTTLVPRTSLGSVVYENGETTIAYQGGGVWRSQGNGTVAISQPEMHYESQTLTIPIISVTSPPGDRRGSMRAVITPSNVDVQLYPNAAQGNPISGENLTLRVHSAYAEGWASYFRSQFGANATVSDGNVSVPLSTIGERGTTSLADRNIGVRGMASGHALTELNVSLAAGSSKFSSMDATFKADAGSRTFRVDVQKPQSGNVKCDGDGGTETLPVRMSYSNGTYYQSWKTTYTGYCVDGTPTLALNLTSPTHDFTYDEPSKSPFGDEAYASAVRFDQHMPVDGNVTYGSAAGATHTAPADFLTAHYMALVRDNTAVSLELYRGNNAAADFDSSTATVDYNESSQAVTFLHASSNNVSVRLT